MMDEMEERERAMELFEIAYQCQMEGELELAIDYYKQSIEVYPTAEAYTFLGWAYSFTGRYRDAIAECEKAIATDPDFGNPYNDIGAYLIELGRYDEAIPYLEKAIIAKRYEALHYPHYNLGRVWEKKGMWFEAIKEYTKALELRSDYQLALRSRARLRAQMN
jgi:tetratricopeptide (TPR) repeat protein